MGRKAGIPNYRREGYGALIRLILLSEREIAKEIPSLLNILGQKNAATKRREFEMRYKWHDMPMGDRIDFWFGKVWKDYK